MTANLLFLCIGFGVSLAIGQILFKAAALAIDPAGGAFLSPALFAAVSIYGCSTVVWIFILTKLPLNVAYPFSLLGSGLVPILAYFFFGEVITVKMMVGLVMVLGGLLVIYAT